MSEGPTSPGEETPANDQGAPPPPPPPTPPAPAAPHESTPPPPAASEQPAPPADAAPPAPPAPEQPAPPAYAAPPAPGQPAPGQPAPPAYAPAPATTGSGAGPVLSIVALVLAGLAFVTSFLGAFAFISWIFGLPAFIVGIIALVKKAQKRPLALTAVIVSVVAFLISIVVFVVTVVMAVDDAVQGANNGSFEEAVDEIIAEDDDNIDTPEIPDVDDTTDTDTDTDADPAGEADLSFGQIDFWKNDSSDRWSYFTIVENTSTEHMWNNARFTIEAYDASGVLLTSDSAYATILPGGKAPLWGTYLDVGQSEIESIDIFLDEFSEGYSQEYVGDMAIGSFIFGEPEVDQQRSYVDVSGTFESTFAEDQESVWVTVVLRDSSGSIVDIGSDVIQRVPASGAVRYSVTVWDVEFEEGMTIELYGDL